MTPSRRLTLRTKLLISFAGFGVLVAALWLLGDRILRDTTTRLEDTLTAHVQPLARMNRLQSQISRIRVLEVELPRLIDLFAVSDQLSLLDAERGIFDRDLGAFVRELKDKNAGEATSLEENWRRYQADLQGVVRHANLMELDAVQRISTFESAARFKSVSHTLKLLAEGTEARARAAFEQAVSEHGRQREIFVATSVTGLAVLAIWMGLLARSVSGRLSRLRDAAAQVAEGRGDRPIAVAGNDELTDLGAAFNAMQEKVREREGALRSSHEELEHRVETRTRELNLEIDERRRIEERLHYQAQYDSLTDLPNRVLAMDRLSQAILAAKRTESCVALIFLDLDDFKKVNDTLGHQHGDALLVQAAKRLRQSVRAEDTVARLGGDEFLVIVGGVTAPDCAQVVAEEIVSAFASAFHIGENEVVVSASVGVAVYPTDAGEPDILLRNADLAMYDAKEAGRSTYRFFNREVHGGSTGRLAIEHRLRGALQRGELRLHYQPLVSTSTRQTVAAEALLRWECPDYGLLGPDHFISIAEHTGLIVEIGDWVLRTACAQARAWRGRGWTDLRIAVNVSPRQFRGDRLWATVRECLATQDLPASCLQLEVTEGLLVRNHPEVQEMLEALSGLGVRLAMDDFGTGYSSLSYLKRFPFHSIKIDREFVRDLARDPDDRALVTAAIRMGKGLGLSVTAEGVETQEQFDFLAAQHCDVVQGALFSMPITPEEFTARWLPCEARVET